MTTSTASTFSYSTSTSMFLLPSMINNKKRSYFGPRCPFFGRKRIVMVSIAARVELPMFFCLTRIMWLLYIVGCCCHCCSCVLVFFVLHLPILCAMSVVTVYVCFYVFGCRPILCDTLLNVLVDVLYGHVFGCQPVRCVTTYCWIFSLLFIACWLMILGDGVLPRRHPQEDATARPLPSLRPGHGRHRARER